MYVFVCVCVCVCVCLCVRARQMLLGRWVCVGKGGGGDTVGGGDSAWIVRLISSSQCGPNL